MATTNLNMTEPTVGADADTWGNELNTLIDTIDAAFGFPINGLTLSAAGSTATFGIASGAASGMKLASAYTKTASAWAVGTGNGALDTGAIANTTWYSVYVIQRIDTGVVDVLTSLSATAPTMPTNYTRKRRIGSMKTDGSAQWIKFSQIGDEFLWAIPVVDANNVTPGATTATSLTLTVPTGVVVNAILDLFLTYASASSYAWISSLDQTDTNPGPGTVNVANVTVSAQQQSVAVNRRTNTSAQVRVRFSSTGCAYYVYTEGWRDRRGQDG